MARKEPQAKPGQAPFPTFVSLDFCHVAAASPGLVSMQGPSGFPKQPDAVPEPVSDGWTVRRGYIPGETATDTTSNPTPDW